MICRWQYSRLNAFVSSHVMLIIRVLLIYRVKPGVTLENAFFLLSFCPILEAKIFGFTTIMSSVCLVCRTHAILFYCCTLVR